MRAGTSRIFGGRSLLLTLLLGIVTTALAVVGVIGYLGMMVEEDHVAVRSIEVPLTDDATWEILADYPLGPRWRPDLSSVELIGADQFIEDGDRGSITYKVLLSEKPARLSRQIVDAGDFGGSWDLVIEPMEGDRCRLTITERGWVSDPWSRFFGDRLGWDAEITAYEDALLAYVGSGAAR